MLDYIGNIGKRMRNYLKSMKKYQDNHYVDLERRAFLRKGLKVAGVVACGGVAFLNNGCAPGEWDDFWAEQGRIWDRAARDYEPHKVTSHVIDSNDPNAPNKTIVNIYVNTESGDGDWDNSGIRREIRRMDRISRQAARDSQAVSEQTGRILRRMEAERKIRENQ